MSWLSLKLFYFFTVSSSRVIIRLIILNKRFKIKDFQMNKVYSSFTFADPDPDGSVLLDPDHDQDYRSRF